MTEEQKIELGVQKFLNLEGKVIEIAKELKIDSKLITQKLNNLGYILRGGATAKQVIAIKNAVDDFIANIDKQINVGFFAKKHGCSRVTLSNRLKSMGYEIINYQTALKFDETIFDEIDTEEKAYWLGFLYADGAISSRDNTIELSLKDSDSEHLEKFNSFMKCSGKNKVKHSTITLNGKEYTRCRWSIHNKHLKEQLIKLGCTPQKSLTLEFPDKSIFKNESLIRHFIRGYWDGDGCLTWSTKEHNNPNIGVVGTESFLRSIQNYLNLPEYKLQLKGNAFQFTIGHLKAFNVTKFLYENSTIYLNRKYERYLEYCRLYEKSDKLLQTNIGEGCDANTEIIRETKESLTS